MEILFLSVVAGLAVFGGLWLATRHNEPAVKADRVDSD